MFKTTKNAIFGLKKRQDFWTEIILFSMFQVIVQDEDLADEDDILVQEEEEVVEGGDYPAQSTGACSEFDVPKTYSSFSGRPVSNTGKFIVFKLGLSLVVVFWPYLF